MASEEQKRNKIKRKELSSPFDGTCSEGGGGGGGGGGGIRFLERESPTSL